MAFQRAILPAVLSWADKLVMIGKYWNTYLIACQCYIYYIAYTGATVVVLFTLLVNLDCFLKILYHVGSRRRGLYNLFGRVHDTLRQIGRVCHHPLCACPACKEQAQAEKHDYFRSHYVTLLNDCYYGLSPALV